MLKYLFESISGTEIFGIISLILFFTAFIIASVWVLRIDKDYVKKMEKLPLENNTFPAGNGTQNSGDQNNG